MGGSIAELLITDPAAPSVRETDDVDVIAAIANYSEYQKWGNRLKALGFSEDTRADAPTCRWLTPDAGIGRLKLDVMPTAATSIGPTNPWYAIGLSTAIPITLTADLDVRILSGPSFLATKWAAFKSRGRDDVMMSWDVEDIIAVVAGRESLLSEIAVAPVDLRSFVAEQTRLFLERDEAEVAIEDALPDARLVPGLIARVRERLAAIAASNQL